LFRQTTVSSLEKKINPNLVAEQAHLLVDGSLAGNGMMMLTLQPHGPPVMSCSAQMRQIG
jgi:hypothetical protein